MQYSPLFVFKRLIFYLGKDSVVACQKSIVCFFYIMMELLFYVYCEQPLTIYFRHLVCLNNYFASAISRLCHRNFCRRRSNWRKLTEANLCEGVIYSSFHHCNFIPLPLFTAHLNLGGRLNNWKSYPNQSRRSEW